MASLSKIEVSGSIRPEQNGLGESMKKLVIRIFVLAASILEADFQAETHRVFYLHPENKLL